MPDLSIIPARALRDPALTSSDLRILGAIGIHTDREGKGAWASVQTMMAESLVGRSTFFAAAAKLLRLGYIERVSRQGRTSIYAIVLRDRPLRATRPAYRTDAEKRSKALRTRPSIVGRGSPEVAGQDPSESSGTQATPGATAVTAGRSASPLNGEPPPAGIKANPCDHPSGYRGVYSGRPHWFCSTCHPDPRPQRRVPPPEPAEARA